MGARDFEVGTGNAIIAATTGYASLGTAHTTAVLCTSESSASGAGASFVLGGMGAGGNETAVLALFNADGSLAYTVGPNLATPGAAIVPPLGVPLILAASKAAGTVAPTFFQHRYDTCVTTIDAAGGTVANRTAGAGTFAIGDFSVGGFPYDGFIGAIAQWNRALSQGELIALIAGRAAWLSMFGRGVRSTGAEAFIDLTQPGTIRDMFNNSIAYTGGTQPAFGPATIRWPGW